MLLPTSFLGIVEHPRFDGELLKCGRLTNSMQLLTSMLPHRCSLQILWHPTVPVLACYTPCTSAHRASLYLALYILHCTIPMALTIRHMYSAQVVALLYYLMSYFPGGTHGVKFMLNMFYQAVLGCFGTVQRTVLK